MKLNSPIEWKTIDSKDSMGQILKAYNLIKKQLTALQIKKLFMEFVFYKDDHLDHIFRLSDQSKPQLFFKMIQFAHRIKTQKGKQRIFETKRTRF